MSAIVIDCGIGNVNSIENAIKQGDLDYAVCRSAIILDPDTDVAILPGVGNCGYLMRRLISTGFSAMIREHIQSGGRFIGVCAGAQVLLESSEEAPKLPLLGVFQGHVNWNPDSKPNTGWRRVRARSTAFANIPIDDYFFFNHLYSCVSLPPEAEILESKSRQGYPVTAGFRIRNVIGLQFHPEKSQRQGLSLLRRLIEG